ncbi:MAG: hypothetical protein ABL984_07025 [Pyrinomonadaceae bacterium]
MKKRIWGLSIVMTILAGLSETSTAQSYTGSPVTKDRLVRAVKSRQFAVPILVKLIKSSGVDFELTPAVENELVAARANPQVIDAVGANYRYARSTGGGTSRGQTPRPPVDRKGESYEQMYYRGVDALTRLRSATNMNQATGYAKSVIDIANQAIAAEASRPEAYTLICAANIATREFSGAERYGQMAIDRGGALAFPVYHLAGQPHIETLHVGSGFVTVESDQKFFQFNGREISSPRSEQNYNTGTAYVAAFSVTTKKAGRTDVWYFAPGITGTSEEAQLIMNLIRKNSL